MMFFSKIIKKKKLLNMGCGSSYHSDWINIDINSSNKDVIECNIINGLPFENATIDVIYSSHVIEHLKENELDNVMKEINRVLKPKGILRLAVPDLEGIVNSYLKALHNVRSDETPENIANYDWMMLELYDQTVRTYSGGKMGDYLSQPQIINKQFIVERIGFEAENYWKNNEMNPNKPIDHSHDSKEEQLIFRSSGEIHHWMYDSFSLKRVMKQYGFADIRKCSAGESRINNFSNYNLEVIDGKERKPDSLYMEGIKSNEDRIV